MCGIAGIISPDPSKVSPEILQRMSVALTHRGPDGDGVWIHDAGDKHVGFAHRRLAILDLSPAAAQPMHFRERYTIVHNGEIYNHEELREELTRLGHVFRTTSDTEAILAAYAEWGAGCLPKLDGMFAFAIWDDEKKEIILARDRFGEKPLYYTWDDDSTFRFASEECALFAAGVKKEPDHASLLAYLGIGRPVLFCETWNGFFKGVHMLPPAAVCVYGKKEGKPHWTLGWYWDLDKSAITPMEPMEAIERFHDLLTRSIQSRLRSDVPIGTSLSGGIDSNSIVALCKHATGKYSHQSFSAVFPGFEKDESAAISASATCFANTAHYARPDATSLLANMDQVIRHQGLPPSSASVFAQYEVFRSVAETEVKVLLDGQGADEILAGYTRYMHWFLQELIAAGKFHAYSAEKKALAANRFLGPWGMANWLATWLPGVARDRIERRARNAIRYQPDLRPQYIDQHYQIGLVEKPLVLSLNDILYADTMQGPLQELLHYADRNAMAFGREVRLPFLDHELVQFIFSLPATLKVHDGFPKWILRKTMEKELPATITWPKGKTGFEPPQKKWMEDPAVQQRIQKAKQVLADHGILNDAALKRDIRPHSAYDPHGRDWRYWMAGEFLS